MKILKSRKEYEEMKKNFSQKIDNFLKDYEEFLDSTSPDYWRQSIYTVINNYKKDIEDFEPITLKDLEQEWVRKEVLTPEEQELWNNSDKYNL